MFLTLFYYFYYQMVEISNRNFITSAKEFYYYMKCIYFIIWVIWWCGLLFSFKNLQNCYYKSFQFLSLLSLFSLIGSLLIFVLGYSVLVQYWGLNVAISIAMIILSFYTYLVNNNLYNYVKRMMLLTKSLDDEDMI